jgi:hypothetical protein
MNIKTIYIPAATCSITFSASQLRPANPCLNTGHLIHTELKSKWSLVIGIVSKNDPLEILFGRSPSWHGLAVDFDGDGHLIHAPIHTSVAIVSIHPVNSVYLMDSDCSAKVAFA